MKGVAERAELAQDVQRVTMTVKESARYLGIGRDVMYWLVHSGAVRSVRIGRQYLLRQVDLDTYLETRATHGAQPMPVAVAPPPAPAKKSKRPVRDGRTPMPGSKITPIPW